MTKDELILAINNKTVYSGSYNLEENYFEITWDGSVAAGFPYEAKSLDDVEQDFTGQSADDVFTLLSLINDYVNTPVEQRSSFDETRKNIRAITACHVDESAGAILPQRGVIITLNDGQELHGKRPYDDICISDFEDTAIDFGNFIIPTAIIRSIQKCGDGND